MILIMMKFIVCCLCDDVNECMVVEDKIEMIVVEFYGDVVGES